MGDIHEPAVRGLVRPLTEAEIAAARRTVASQACRLAPEGPVEAARTVLDALGLLPVPTLEVVGRG